MVKQPTPLYASGFVERQSYVSPAPKWPRVNVLCVACGHFFPLPLAEFGPPVTRVRTCPDCTSNPVLPSDKEKEWMRVCYEKLTLACQAANADVRG